MILQGQQGTDFRSLPEPRVARGHCFHQRRKPHRAKRIERWNMIGPWCYGPNWDPRDFCAEALSSNVTMFGGGACKEVMKV